MFRSELKWALLLRKTGVPPTGPADRQHVAEDSASPYLAEYDAADAGKAAHWAIRWENSSGQHVPCSAVTRWTIPG